MKRVSTLIVMLGFSLAGYSQPVISNLAPNFGDHMTYKQSDTAPDPGPAGANITWDFSNEVIQNYTAEYSVEHPEDVSGSDMFPNATMVWVVDIGVGVLNSFMSFQNNAFTEYGNNSEFSGTTSGKQYTDPLVHFTYPLEYQNTDSDDYAGNVFGITGTNNFTGSVIYEVDGYGTIITPFGTYDNVLRITANSVELLGTLGFTTTDSITETSWYSPDVPVPVMVITSEHSSLFGIPMDSSKTTTALSEFNGASSSLGGENNRTTFSIFPNPASDYIQIAFDAKGSNTSVLRLADNTGRVIKNERIDPNEKVDISGLKPGIYIASLLMNGERSLYRPFCITR